MLIDTSGTADTDSVLHSIAERSSGLTLKNNITVVDYGTNKYILTKEEKEFNRFYYNNLLHALADDYIFLMKEIVKHKPKFHRQCDMQLRIGKNWRKKRKK